MGNLWSSTKIRPVPGTYLEDRPLRRRPTHQRVASFIPLPAPPIVNPINHRPPVPYKDKARRMFHTISVRQHEFNQGTLIQTRE
jgi:hypothetical protein